jgi:hypothetical protein
MPRGRRLKRAAWLMMAFIFLSRPLRPQDAVERVTGCEHVAFLRPSISEGLGGPALDALKSWDG